MSPVFHPVREHAVVNLAVCPRVSVEHERLSRPAAVKRLLMSA
jgi:hypothetical protein